MTVSAEFATIDLILASSAETRGVDAFALSVIKIERQLRKLFTHLIFQFPCFSNADVETLRDTLSSNNSVYFEGIENGINHLFSCTVQNLVGTNYEHLRGRVDEAISYRNKIFHGQLTDEHLEREALLSLVAELRAWCVALADGAIQHIGYDGFMRNSFQKSSSSEIFRAYKVQFNNTADYVEFIKGHMQRQSPHKLAEARSGIFS